FCEPQESDLVVDGAPGSGVLDLCDPESADFHEQVLRCLLARSARLRASGAWSLMELNLTEADFSRLRRWSKIGAFDLSDLAKQRLPFGPLSFTGVEAIALTFLACCCEIGRNVSTEGELGPALMRKLVLRYENRFSRAMRTLSH